MLINKHSPVEQPEDWAQWWQLSGLSSSGRSLFFMLTLLLTLLRPRQGDYGDDSDPGFFMNCVGIFKAWYVQGGSFSTKFWCRRPRGALSAGERNFFVSYEKVNCGAQLHHKALGPWFRFSEHKYDLLLLSGQLLGPLLLCKATYLRAESKARRPGETDNTKILIVTRSGWIAEYEWSMMLNIEIGEFAAS